MARIETFDRDIKLATAGLAPQNIAKELAKLARSELSKALSSGEASPDYERFVNGRRGVIEDDVIPPGPILYVFTWWTDIITYAIQYLIDRSPERSGRYKRSWIVLANGRPVSNPKDIPAGAEVTITNDQPYHRKIDVGHMRMSVERYIIDDARMAVNRIFGNLVSTRRAVVTLPNSYVLKGYFRRGFRKFARTKIRRDTAAGQRMMYPALVMNLRAIQ